MPNTIHTHLLPDTGSGARIWPLPALYLVLILTPNATVLPWIQSSYDEKRLLQIGVLLIVGLALSICPRTARSCAGSWSALPRLARHGILGVLGLGVVSSLLAAAPRYALLETSHWSLMLCMALLIAAFYRDTRGRLIVGFSGVLAISVLLYLVTFVAAFVAARANGGSVAPEYLLPGFYNIRFLGQFQTWTLPLLALPLVTGLGPRFCGAGLSRALLSGWWCIAFVSEGRGTIAAVTVAILTCVLVFKTAARPMLKEQLLAAALGLMIYSILFLAPTAGLDDATLTAPASAETTGLNQRGELWDRALDMSNDHPWLGVGPLHYAYYPNPLAAHPHNAVLQWTAEWGLPATLLVTALLIWGLWCWTRSWRGTGPRTPEKSQHHLAVALTASALAAATHAMVSGIIVMPLSQLMLITVTGLMLGLYQANMPSVRGGQGKIPWRLRLLAGVLVGVTVALLAPNLIAESPGSGGKLEATLSADGPRYWMTGDSPR